MNQLFEAQTRGGLRRYIVAESEEDARKELQDPNKHPDLHFRSVSLKSVDVEGYTITITPNEETERPKKGRPKKEGVSDGDNG